MALAAVAVGAWAARRSVDFPVYYATALAWRRHGGPVYGPHPGLGWPMYYRYPPLFVLLFAPLTWLSRAWAAGLWAAGKVVVLAVLVRALARRLRATGPPNAEWPAAGQSAGKGFAGGRPGSARWLPLSMLPRAAWRRWIAALIPVLLTATYLLVEFRYGNVQFYVFALVATAFLVAARPGTWREAGAAALLALAAAIKVWPLFFIPYWLARRRYRAAGLAVLFTLILTLAPLAAWGWRGNLRLLAQWERQERGTALGAGTIWYPSQSLRGVLTRYLTHIPPAATGGAYPPVNLAAWSDAAISRVWLGLDLLGYAGLLAFAWRSRAAGEATEGVAFCALALLMPFAHIEDLVVILWPAMVAGVYLARRGSPPRPVAATLLWAAALWAAVIPLIPGHAAQRWLQAAGADFAVVALLAAGLALAAAQAAGMAPLGRAQKPNRQLRGEPAG